MSCPSWSAHGGPDAAGVPVRDFSTNANACGPAPGALRAVQSADASRYPDPAGAALREALAERHGVSADRIVLASSASEFIVRITTAMRCLQTELRVHLPSPGYGDYARAAGAVGATLVSSPAQADLLWHTQPGSPLGNDATCPTGHDTTLTVIDAAYAPLRLAGDAPAWPDTAWQLWSPNKALGLTGVRAAYAIAPDFSLGVSRDRAPDPTPAALTQRLISLAPSWPIGAHGVAMLHAWAGHETQRWLKRSLATLAEWKARQLALCASLGWTCTPSVVPFYVARPPEGLPLDHCLALLRAQGIKLRDTASMGLPGAWRMSVQHPEAQQALRDAWPGVLAELTP